MNSDCIRTEACDKNGLKIKFKSSEELSHQGFLVDGLRSPLVVPREGTGAWHRSDSLPKWKETTGVYCPATH